MNELDRTISTCTRRTFISTYSAALAGITLIPRYVLGGPGYVPPSDRVSAACIGVGSQGFRVMINFLQQPEMQIVSVCDVNSGSGDYVEWGANELRNKGRELLNDSTWGASRPGAWAGVAPSKDLVDRYYAVSSGQASRKDCTAYTDYRELLDRETDIDAVIIGTPDHLHAPIAIDAMKHGKHVYCQKPMAHTVYEARKMAEVARETGVATQVAIGNSASEDTRILTEWIQAGAIGSVREVHNWSSRPFWPQGIDRPAESQPVPEYLNWDLWLGPVPYRPYHAVYQPFVWRGWYDFGTGAIGDMGCYSFDTIFRALGLTAPGRVDASSTPLFPETYPSASVVHFDFAAVPGRPAVTLHWYDGGLKPSIPEELEGDELPEEGLLFVGDQGKVLCGFSGGEPRLIPEPAHRAFTPPPQTLPRSVGHYEEWISACKGGPAAAASFEFSSAVTETILLGNVALRAKRPVHWNPGEHTIAMPDEANQYLNQTYREGWMI